MRGKEEILKLKDLFEMQRAETLEAIHRLDREARAATANDPEDVGDTSVRNYSKELLFQQLSANRSRLKNIDAALRRIRMGNFGVCSNCGNEIPIKRLEAMPWTAYCRDCQEELEKASAMPAEDIAVRG